MGDGTLEINSKQIGELAQLKASSQCGQAQIADDGVYKMTLQWKLLNTRLWGLWEEEDASLHR